VPQSYYFLKAATIMEELQVQKLPVKSILSNTSEIVSLCEWAELTVTTSNYNEGLVETNPPASQLRFVLVTELAALLHLGSYNHARHLWHRYRPTTTTTTTTVVSGVPQEERAVVDEEMDQFQRLWTAAQPILLAVSGQQECCKGQTLTQNKLVTSHETFYRELRVSCIEPQLEPLATFAKELILSERMRMVRLLEETFDSLPRTPDDYEKKKSGSSSCRLMCLLGYETRLELELFLKDRNWNLLQEEGFWIPGSFYLEERNRLNSGWNINGKCEEPEEQKKNEQEIKDDKIHFLTSLVGFMESKGLDGT